MSLENAPELHEHPDVDHVLTVLFATIKRTRRCEFFYLVVVALCATLAGPDGWADIERFGNARIDWLRTFLPLANGAPAHDTFGRVFSRLDPARLLACIQQCLDDIGHEIGKHIAIDGKTLRRLFDNAADKKLNRTEQ